MAEAIVSEEDKKFQEKIRGMLDELKAIGEVDPDVLTKEESPQKPQEKPKEENKVVEEKKETVEEKKEESKEDDLEDGFVVVKGKKIPIESFVADVESQKIEKEDLSKDELSQLKEQALGDVALEKAIEILEKNVKKVQELEKFYEQKKKEEEEEKNRKMLLKMKEEVEKKYDVTLPSIESHEFKMLMETTFRANPLELALLLTQPDAIMKTKKQTPKTVPSSENEETSDSAYIEKLKEVASKAGVSFEKIKKYI